ncbi:MAG: hypothetical protein JRJ79_17750 [Deltaproteobacteria bacterium]|nr:hypothetical protein [Deltaproteobacteria bacterium]MBW1795389.1 hypothetical protein [Deltaproteobacteria bacterium]
MRKNLKHMKYFLAISLALFLTAVTVFPALAEEEKPSADLSVAVLSDYIWRGQELSRDSAVIQPSMTISYQDFSANLWSNLDTDPYTSTHGENNSSACNETDFTLSYAREFGPVSVEGGYIYYGLEGVDDSQEVFLSLGLDTLLSPALTVYRDVHKYQHWYFLLGISHSFEISKAVSLELSASASYLESLDADAYPEIDSSGAATNDEFSHFHDGVISASLPVSVAKYITITPSLAYTFALSSDASDEMEWRSAGFRGKTSGDDNFVYGGVTVSVAF